MGESKIEWTERTWNPVVGCSVLTPGCTNCYAMKMAARIEAMKCSHYDGTTKKVNGNTVWTGKLALAPDHILLEPLKRKKPTTYFVNSMGDLFHEDCPDEWIDRVFAVMASCPHHTFQVLTKRAERMRAHLTSWTLEEFTWPLPNVWLGVSCERQQEADERIPHLLQTPAAVRFISAEPLLGPIDLARIQLPSGALCDTLTSRRDGAYVASPSTIDWVIVGGESGSNARPAHPDWVRSLREQCRASGTVLFFFKQWGAHKPIHDARTHAFIGSVKIGKKAAGRLLDGKEHNAMPGRVTG